MIVAVPAAVSPLTAHAGPLTDADRVGEAKLGLAPPVAGGHGDPPRVSALIDGLAGSSDDKINESVNKLGALGDPQAIPALDALCDDRLRVGPDGHTPHVGIRRLATFGIRSLVR